MLSNDEDGFDEPRFNKPRTVNLEESGNSYTIHDPSQSYLHSHSNKLSTDDMKKKKKKKENGQPKSKFKRVVKRAVSKWESLIGAKLPTERTWKIDYVLVYKKTLKDSAADAELERTQAAEMRRRFEAAIRQLGAELRREGAQGSEFTYVKVHMPFWRLCKEAERLKLEMPIKGFETYQDEDLCQCWTNFANEYLETDRDEVDYASSPLVPEKLHLFEGGDNADTFFRPALRSFLTHMILINMNIYKKERDEFNSKASCDHRHQEYGARVYTGLLYMLHKKFYCDAFVLHDETRRDPHVIFHLVRLRALYGSQVKIGGEEQEQEEIDIDKDTRRVLNDTWTKFYKYQPLWKIRNYFGERIALYFAWCGMLMTSLWIPMLFGIAVFLYGLYLSIVKSQNHTMTNSTYISANSRVEGFVEDSIDIIKGAFDNNLTPFFALFISIWGTVFLEAWKRTNRTLAYEWDVDTFESCETDRPQFVGTVEIPDPVVRGQTSMQSPFYRQFFKFAVSASVLILMVMLVFIVAAAILLYRIAVTVNYCGSITSTQCLLLTSICSSLLNAIVILLLGLLYDYVAVKLTDWENHRTQTEYHDSLVVKLFAFQFANSYTSLFYIAFFRGRVFLQDGIFGLGPTYTDNCGVSGSCMSELSFQVLILMLIKPLPKFLTDVLMPAAVHLRSLVYLWRAKLKRLFQLCFGCCRPSEQGDPRVPGFIEREHQKQRLGDFTLGEYTEKVIIYGFLMLFATSFPLAPLLAFLILLVDIRVDAKRMLWLDRRPVAEIAQDIGMWYAILQFLNVVGVVSNACLIAFTSFWGEQFDAIGKLVVVIVFLIIVFSIKFIIAACIPDVPSAVKLAIKREKYQVERLFENDMEEGGHEHSNIYESYQRDLVGDDDQAEEEQSIKLNSRDVKSRFKLYDRKRKRSMSELHSHSADEQRKSNDDTEHYRHLKKSWRNNARVESPRRYSSSSDQWRRQSDTDDLVLANRRQRSAIDLAYHKSSRIYPRISGSDNRGYGSDESTQA